ncbi:MAG TPA: carboxypeptidase-like regulatory domain-containing protein [Candidatus Angelobacter sp.]
MNSKREGYLTWRLVTGLLATILIVSLAPPVAWAANTGDLSGTVVDQNGAVIQGATVTIKNTSTGAVRTVPTNEFGLFSAPQLEIGSYTLVVNKSGFKQYSETVIVRSGENTRVAAQLPVGGTSETVTVEGGLVPTLDVATAQVSESFSAEQVLALPNQARDPVAYATLSPGTVPVSKDNPFLGTGSFNSNGSRGRANNITVDGIIASDISTTGEAGLGTFSYDGVQEFKLITNNFDAEFGRNSGSQVQIITKSGTNGFHGTAYEFYQASFFNARDFFLPTNPDGTPGVVPRFSQNQGGFTFGGPIFKDHTYFFGHWEMDKTRGSGGVGIAHVMTSAQAAGITDPSSLALFNAQGSPSSATGLLANPAPNQDNGHAWSVRIDQNLRGGKDSFFVRYGENPDTSVNPGLTFIGSNLPGVGAQFTGTARTVSLGWSTAVSTNLLNQFRAGFGRSVADFARFSTFPEGPQVVIGGLDSFGTDQIIPQGRTQNVFQYGDTLSWVHGRHTFKFGGDVFRYQSPSFFDAAFAGVITYANVAAFQSGTVTSWAQRVGTSDRHNFALDFFEFVQDDFRVTPTITLNLGYRLESSGGVSEGSNLISNIDPTNHTPLGVLGLGPLGGVDLGGTAFHRNWNSAPRVGIAWNPGRGKMVVRAGYGIAYDYIFLNPITNLRFAAPFIPTLTVISPSPGQVANLLAGTDATQAAALAAVGHFNPASFNFGSISAVAQNLQNPRNQQWNFGLEHQITKALTLKASYIGTKNDHLQVTMPLNLTNPLLRPAPATSLADQLARTLAFKTFIAGETGNAGLAAINRIDPRFNTVTQVQSIGTSSYNSLQLEAIGRYGSWLTFNANYTYGHSIDTVSDSLGVLVNDSATIANPTQPLSANRANSEFDLRQRFVANYVYQIPFARNLSNHAFRRVLDGWSITNIFSTQTGFPVTLLAGSLPGFSDPLLLGGGLLLANGNALTLQPSAFTAGGVSNFSQPLVGNQGTSGRNHLRLDGLTDLDTALTKRISITEKTNLQLRWEMFNALNHPNLSGFLNTLTANPAASGFGTYTSTATNMRQMQVSARFQF